MKYVPYLPRLVNEHAYISQHTPQTRFAALQHHKTSPSTITLEFKFRQHSICGRPEPHLIHSFTLQTYYSTLSTTSHLISSLLPSISTTLLISPHYQSHAYTHQTIILCLLSIKQKVCANQMPLYLSERQVCPTPYSFPVPIFSSCYHAPKKSNPKFKISNPAV